MNITKDADGLIVADADGSNPRRLSWEDCGAIVAAIEPELERIAGAPHECVKRAIRAANAG